MRSERPSSRVGFPSWGGVALLLLGPMVAGAQDGDWPMYNHDVRGSRFNDAETTLGVSNVGAIQEVWKFEIPDASVSGTPVVAGGMVYVGDSSGRVWGLSESKGTPRWRTQLSGPISATALVTGRLVIIGVFGTPGDPPSGSRLYGLNRRTGEIEWATELDPHPLRRPFGCQDFG